MTAPALKVRHNRDEVISLLQQYDPSEITVEGAVLMDVPDKWRRFSKPLPYMMQLTRMTIPEFVDNCMELERAGFAVTYFIIGGDK